jgi:hypothetical protein
LALAAGAALAAPTQFDLVCSGWERAPGVIPQRPYQVRYSIDLDAKVWCWRACIAIREVTPSRLVLSDLDRNAGIDRLLFIERDTGKLSDTWGSTGLERQATCEPAPFTPPPKAKF